MPTFSNLYSSRLDRELGNDDTGVLFTSARRKAAINEAMVEFADLTECWQRTSTITCVGGVAEYDLTQSTTLGSTDFVRLSKEQVQFKYRSSNTVTVLSGDDLPRREVEWLNRYEPGWQHSTVSTATGQQLPALYYERTDGGARLLGFFPTPSTASSGTMTAVVPYVALPAPLTSDTQEPFTVNGQTRTDLRPYHQGLVHYAAYQLEKLRRDQQASESQLQKFAGYVARYLQNKRIKNGRTLTTAKNYFQRRTGESS